MLGTDRAHGSQVCIASPDVVDARARQIPTRGPGFLVQGEHVNLIAH